MGWSIAVGLAVTGDVGRLMAGAPNVDEDATSALVDRLRPGDHFEECGETVLDFALWPYEDEVFAAAYDGALVWCDRALFGIGQEARRSVEALATALPEASCALLVLHAVVASSWFRLFDKGTLRRSVLVTEADGIVMDQGEHLPCETAFWDKLDAADDVPLPFDHEQFGLELAAAYMFGQPIAERHGTGISPLELPVRRFRRITRT